MLKDIFQDLDEWIMGESEGAFVRHATFRIFGQSALLEAGMDIELERTGDLDSYTEAGSKVLGQLEKMLKEKGLAYDHLSGQAWMPPETEYTVLHKGAYVEALVAKPVYVMISKAKGAPEKNKMLLSKYLANNPPDLFYKLAEKHGIDIAAILR